MGRRRNLARESSSAKKRENATGELLTAAATVGNGIPYAKGPQMTKRRSRRGVIPSRTRIRQFTGHMRGMQHMCATAELLPSCRLQMEHINYIPFDDICVLLLFT